MTRDCRFCLPVPDELALLSTPLLGLGHGRGVAMWAVGGRRLKRCGDIEQANERAKERER